MFRKLWEDIRNWCAPFDAAGIEKEPSWLFTFWSHLLYPIPWQDEPCWCCASVRGFLYGVLVSTIFWWIV